MEKINFPAWLRSEINNRGWSQADLSRNTKISPTQIARIFSGERSMGLESLVAIANALNISPITIIRKAGLLPEGSEVTNFEDWQFLIAQLMPEEQEEVREIMQMKIERRQKADKSARAENFKSGKIKK